MNSPAENRRRIAAGANAPTGNAKRGGANGDEAWSRMLLNHADMKFAADVGGVNIRPDNNEPKRLPHRRNF
jgi:hypothetical protein